MTKEEEYKNKENIEDEEIDEEEEEELKSNHSKPSTSNSFSSGGESFDEEEDDDDDDSSDSDSDSDSESDSFDLTDVQIQSDDTLEVKSLKMKLLKEKSKVLDAKETISTLVDQITVYKASVEEEKLVLEASLKQEKKTKLELFEIYKELEIEKENLSKQLEIVILECEQLEQEKQTISKENINNLQTLMNEITHIEEHNSLLEKELENEKEQHRITNNSLQEQMILIQKLESFNRELSSSGSGSGNGTGGGVDQVLLLQLKKQLAETQVLLNQEREKLQNLDSLLFQGRKIIGFAEKNGGHLDQNAVFEINALKTSIEQEKQNNHKINLQLEEERKKSELNKKTSDNLVARMKELISSHHETLQLLDEEKENSKQLIQEIQTLKENQVKTTNNNNNNNGNNNNNIGSTSTIGESSNSNITNPAIQVTTQDATSGANSQYEEGKLRPDPSTDSISSQSSTEAGGYVKVGNSQKMYKTLRLKKTQTKLGGDLNMLFAPEKPTSPENSSNNDANNSNNNNENNNNNDQPQQHTVMSSNSVVFQSKNSVKFGAGFQFITPETSKEEVVVAPGSPIIKPKSNKTSKLDKKIEKEKKDILKKIQKDLKQKAKEEKKLKAKEKEKDLNNSKNSSSSSSGSGVGADKDKTSPNNGSVGSTSGKLTSSASNPSSLNNSGDSHSNTHPLVPPTSKSSFNLKESNNPETDSPQPPHSPNRSPSFTSTKPPADKRKSIRYIFSN